MRTLIKIVVWTIGVVVALVIIAIIAVRIFFPTEKAKSYAIEKGSEALGRPVGIESVSVSFWGGIGVKLVGVSIGNPAGMAGADLLRAKDVDVKLRLLPLLSKQVKIDRFVVEAPEVNMFKTISGENNFTFGKIDSALPVEAQSVPPEAKTAAAAISFEKLEIRDGRVQYRDDSSGLSATLDNLNLNTALENPREGYYVSSGRIKIDSVRVKTIQPIPVVSAGLTYRASYDMNAKHLSIEKGDFDVNGMKLDLSGDLFHPSGSLRGKARVKTEDIAIADILALLPPERTAKLAPFRVSGNLAVDADVEYDEAKKQNALNYSGTAVITDMVLARKDIPGELKIKNAVIAGKPDNVRLTIEEGVFNGRPLKGSFVLNNFADPYLNGNLAGSLDFAYLKPFLPVTDRHELTGEARFDVKFAGKVKDPKNMDFSGDIDIEHGSYNAGFLPEKIDTFMLDAYFDRNVVTVRKFVGISRSANLSFSGRIDHLVSWAMADSVQAREIHPGVDGNLSGQVNLAALNSFLPQQRHPSLSGQLALDLSVVGNMGDLAGIRPRGKISVVNATYQDSLLPEPVKRLDADMRISPDSISVEQLRVQFVSSDASFSGQLTKPFPYLLPLKDIDRSKLAKPFFAFKLTSKRFDSDKLFPAAVPGSGAIKPTTTSLDSIPGIIVPDIDGQGTFAIDTLIYDKIDFTSIQGKIKIYSRKIDCYDVSGKVYTGSVTGKTTIDLANFEDPRYTGDFNATQIEANDFVTRFSPFGGHLFGKIDLNGQFDAAGWEPDQFMQSLTLNGLGSIADGKLVTSGALYDAINGIASKVGQSFSKDQPLKGLKSAIAVKDGKVILDNLKTTLPNIGELDLGGFYAFSGNIGYTGSLFLNPQTTQNVLSSGMLGSAAGLLTDAKTQRIRLPLVITGTIDKPTVQLDMSAIQKNAVDKLKENPVDLIKGLFKKK